MPCLWRIPRLEGARETRTERATSTDFAKVPETGEAIAGEVLPDCLSH